VPIADGLTPHGLRHTHKTLMEELGTPSKLTDGRMGHEDGSVQARYSRATLPTRRQLVDGLTASWTVAVDLRRATASRSLVSVLDQALTVNRKDAGERPPKSHAP